ncbi:hypothetical protein, partial [Phyllobacterium sp. P5_D12]
MIVQDRDAALIERITQWQGLPLDIKQSAGTTLTKVPATTDRNQILIASEKVNSAADISKPLSVAFNSSVPIKELFSPD